MASPLNESRLEHYRAAYERELERRREGMDRLSNLITVFTLIGGILVYFFSNVPQPRLSFLYLIFAFLVITGAALATCGFALLAYMVKRGAVYSVLNTPKVLDQEILDGLKSGRITAANDLLYSDEFKAVLLDSYRDFGTENQITNNLREIKFNRILIFATYAVVLLVLAAPIHFYLNLVDEKKPLDIKVESPILIMTAPNSSSGQPATPAPPPTPVQTAQPPANTAVPSNALTPVSLTRPPAMQVFAAPAAMPDRVALARPPAQLINEAAAVPKAPPVAAPKPAAAPKAAGAPTASP
jgi:hypothetical protein